MQFLFERWATQILDGIPNLLTAIAIFVVALYLARVSANFLVGVLHRRRVVSNVVSLLSHGLYWTIVMVGLVMALQRFFDVTAFLAGLGIIGFTVGFALQDVMKNFAAGIILLLQQPFRVGEAINVAGFDGTILAIDLRATEMSTFDGRLVSIPNATILTNPITNFTRAARRRVDIPLQVPPGADLEVTRSTVLNAIRQTPGFVSDPAPTVVLQQFGESAIDLSGAFWVDVSKNNPDVARDIALTRIKADLERRNIAAPPAAQGNNQPPSGDGRQSDQ